MKGFFEAYNWMAFPLMLPAALYILRRMMRMSFGESDNSPLASGNKPYAPIRFRALHLANSGGTLVAAFIADLVIHVIDMKATVFRFFGEFSECPNDIDWGLYYFVFNDLPRWQTGILIGFTTFEQFLLAMIALLLLINLARFNQIYLNSIFIRSAPRHDNTFVLDFDDAKYRFGLSKLSDIFNLQLGALSAVGLFFLVSRYNNVNSDPVALLFGLYSQISDLLTGNGADITFETLSQPLTQLFPDAGQVMIPFLWLLMAYVVIQPVRVKLLPLKYVGARDGRVAYLEQFVPPMSKYGKMLARNQRTDVDAVAEVFREHSFWPSGDIRAAERVFGCSIVFWILLFPIVPKSPLDFGALVLTIILSIGFAKLYLSYLIKYRLKRIDPSLVKK